MSSSTISITQALSELKLLTKRLEGSLDTAKFVTIKTKKSLLDTNTFAIQARGTYQSFRDLLCRYTALKAAIVRINATTTLTIAGKTYTIAEAVERKRAIEFEKRLLTTMKTQWNTIQKEYTIHCDTERVRIDRLLTTELGKDRKTDSTELKMLMDTLVAENKAEVLDPLHLEEKISDMTKEIEEFETHVDWSLSEINGKTLISFTV